MTAQKVRYFCVLGLFTLLVAFITVGSLIFLFQTIVHPTIPIENIRVSNISENSLSLSWVSYKPMKVWVYYSKYSIPLTARLVVRILPKSIISKIFNLQSSSDDFGPILTTAHHVTLKNLEPEARYHYLISTGFRFYTKDLQGEPLPPIQTIGLLESAPSLYPCYGKVLDFAEEMPDSPVIVYVSSENASLISAFTNSAGNYSLDLSSLRTKDLRESFNLGQSVSLDLEVEGGQWGRANKPLFVKSCQPVDVIMLE